MAKQPQPLLQPKPITPPAGKFDEVPKMDFSRKREVAPSAGFKPSEARSESTKSQHTDADCVQNETDGEPTVGFYTKSERLAKIMKYREKIQRFLRGENKNKDRYILRSKIAKAKPRVGGKFAKKTNTKQTKHSGAKRSRN